MKEFERRILKTIIRAMELMEYEEELHSIEDIKERAEIDSLAVLEILVTLEEEFDISLDEAEITVEVAKDLKTLSCIIDGKLKDKK